MIELYQKIMAFLREDDGASAVEYAVLVGLIAVAIAASVTNLGKKVAGTFTSIADSLPGAGGGGGCG
jgi:pilus assembly protein Flp/PilA